MTPELAGIIMAAISLAGLLLAGQKVIRSDLSDIRKEIGDVRKDVHRIAERVSRIEGVLFHKRHSE